MLIGGQRLLFGTKLRGTIASPHLQSLYCLHVCTCSSFITQRQAIYTTLPRAREYSTPLFNTLTATSVPAKST